MAQFTFDTDWTGGTGAIDRSQQLSAGVAAAAHVLAASVARDAGGAEAPASISEHLSALRDAAGDLARAFENMAGQIEDMRQRNILISVSEQDTQARRAAEAAAALRAAATGAQQLNGLISTARGPLLDLALTDEADSVVWDRYE